MTAPMQQYPAQYPPPPQQFQPQQFPQPAYPPQQPSYVPGYPPPTMAPPAAPLAQGSIDDFYNQPSTGGGKSLSFEQVGTRHVGIVTRAISSGDIQQQTDTRGVPLLFRDGRPKYVMRVPLQMQPSPAYPDGLAQWYVKGQVRDELVRAMAEAGAPAGPPEAGAVIDVTHTGTRPSGPGMSPAKLFHVTYTRPDGQTSSPVPAIAQQPAQQFAQPAPAPVVQPPVQQPQQPAQAAPAMPADLDPAQQALLAKLTGQQVPQG